MCNIPGHGCLQMEPGLTALMAKSRNYDELVAGWKGWRNATGKQMKDLYAEFVELRNEGAKISGREYILYKPRDIRRRTGDNISIINM